MMTMTALILVGALGSSLSYARDYKCDWNVVGIVGNCPQTEKLVLQR